MSLAGAVFDCHKREAGDQGEEQAVTGVPGLPGQVPGGGCGEEGVRFGVAQGIAATEQTCCVLKSHPVCVASLSNHKTQNRHRNMKRSMVLNTKI